jgi:RNA polymerase sigma-70 factor, ECF subfamily
VTQQQLPADADLRAVFVAHLYGGRGGLPMPADLDITLRHLWEVGRAAWPALPQLDTPLFARHLAERIPLGADIARTFTNAHIPDLYLACACTHGIKGAIEQFMAVHSGTVAAFLSRIDGSPAFADEVRQRLWERLFVADSPDAPLRIAGYSGSGPLSSWVGVSAQRVGLSLLRGEKRHAETAGESLAEALPAGVDIELDYLRMRYRVEFREAVQVAIAALTQRERVILRLHLVNGLSHEKIGALYNRKQSTVTRWIAQAREAIGRETQRHLRERLHVSTSELQSIAQLVASQLDLSIARWLGEEMDRGPS